MNKCNNCEKENDDLVKYCNECGYKLHSTEKVDASVLENDNRNTEKNQKTNQKQKLKTTIGFIVGFGIMTFTTNYFLKKPTFDKAMIEIFSTPAVQWPMR